jgi:hypothetical protein
MAGSPLLLQLLRKLGAGHQAVARVFAGQEEGRGAEEPARERSDSVTSTDSGFGEPGAAGGNPDTGLPVIWLDEVAAHCTPLDGWMVLYDRVYDVSRFLREHPGGEEVMAEYLGYDGTLAFRGVGHSGDAIEMLEKFLIGVLPGAERLNFRH